MYEECERPRIQNRLRSLALLSLRVFVLRHGPQLTERWSLRRLAHDRVAERLLRDVASDREHGLRSPPNWLLGGLKCYT